MRLSMSGMSTLGKVAKKSYKKQSVLQIGKAEPLVTVNSECLWNKKWKLKVLSVWQRKEEN